MPSSALQVARTGLEAQDARMRVIANNLANVSTTAFKRDRPNFATLAYQDARVAGAQSSTETTVCHGSQSWHRCLGAVHHPHGNARIAPVHRQQP